MTRAIITIPLAACAALFADAAVGANEFVSVHWEQVTALVALIFVLVFIIVKLVPDMLAKASEQAKVFAAASQAQTDSSVKATAQASSEATKAMATMHENFVNTLDKLSERYHDDTTNLSQSISDLSRTCAVNGGSTIHDLRKQREEEHGK